MRLRFWIKQGFETVFMILLCSLIYGFFMFVQGNDGWIGLLVLLPLYLLLFGALLMIAMTTAIHKLAVPLAISFGSTRNEVLLGLQLYRVIPVCLIPALATILTALGGEQSALPVSAVFPLFVFCVSVYSILNYICSCTVIICTLAYHSQNHNSNTAYCNSKIRIFKTFFQNICRTVKHQTKYNAHTCTKHCKYNRTDHRHHCQIRYIRQRKICGLYCK